MEGREGEGRREGEDQARFFLWILTIYVSFVGILEDVWKFLKEDEGTSTWKCLHLHISGRNFKNQPFYTIFIALRSNLDLLKLTHRQTNFGSINVRCSFYSNYCCYCCVWWNCNYCPREKPSGVPFNLFFFFTLDLSIPMPCWGRKAVLSFPPPHITCLYNYLYIHTSVPPPLVTCLYNYLYIHTSVPPPLVTCLYNYLYIHTSVPPPLVTCLYNYLYIHTSIPPPHTACLYNYLYIHTSVPPPHMTSLYNYLYNSQCS